MNRVDLGTIVGVNHPCRVASDTRAYGWKLFAAYLAVCLGLALGWVIWADAFKF